MTRAQGGKESHHLEPSFGFAFASAIVLCFVFTGHPFSPSGHPHSAL